MTAKSLGSPPCRRACALLLGGCADAAPTKRAAAGAPRAARRLAGFVAQLHRRLFPRQSGLRGRPGPARI